MSIVIWVVTVIAAFCAGWLIAYRIGRDDGFADGYDTGLMHGGRRCA